jgi:SAM-dependent methyltransferase
VLDVMGKGLGHFARDLALAALPVAVVGAAIIAWTFPYATDDPVRREVAIEEFYSMVYGQDAEAVQPKALEAADRFNIHGTVSRLVTQYHWEHARVLEVGSGTGYLQDIVEDYTGLDIAPSAASYYHKPFVAGTATAMPFPDRSFDVLWSVWVLEHIPNPEAALREMRRVVKPGGYLYLQPAWDVPHWAARGLDVRPYADLSWRDRAEKLTLPVRSSLVVWTVAHVPMRVIRSLSASPTTLHYRRLTPNYRETWQPDHDAVNDLDAIEVARWFESRGDICLTCAPGWREYMHGGAPLLIRRGE